MSTGKEKIDKLLEQGNIRFIAFLDSNSNDYDIDFWLAGITENRDGTFTTVIEDNRKRQWYIYHDITEEFDNLYGKTFCDLEFEEVIRKYEDYLLDSRHEMIEEFGIEIPDEDGEWIEVDKRAEK